MRTSTETTTALEAVQEQYFDGSNGEDSSNGLDDSRPGTDSDGTTTQETEAGLKTESSSEDIANDGRKSVMGSKLLLLFILAVAAATVGYATYRNTSQQENEAFEIQFKDYAHELKELVHQEFKAIFLSVKNFGNTVTSYALDQGSTWPFVTMPHFEVLGTGSNELTGAAVLALSPIVNLHDREAWEVYATENQGWIADGIEVHEEWHKYATSKEGWELENISYPIWRNGANKRSVTDLSSGPYLPVWQLAPAPTDPAIVNFNLHSNSVFHRIFHAMKETDMPVLSETTDLRLLYQGSMEYRADQPESCLLYPIHQYFKEERDHDKQANPLVGAAVAALRWDKAFLNLMPDSAIGIIIVVRDTCEDVFSYRVDGSQVTYLGWGDFHDPKYNYLEEITPVVSFIAYGVSETSEHCEYFLYIYPSEDLHNQYLTSKPAMYTTIIVLVFVLTTTVFVLYDFFVQRRNYRVVLKAKRSHAIVSSLFPKNVRERIMKEAEEQVEAELAADGTWKRNRHSAAKSQLKNFLSDGTGDAPKNEGAVNVFAGKPIADLFPAATVMFGDISGFTAWSSVREPSQVFQLLETLYNAFDEIANRRRVFKVETVGDCYVAVAGLPEPRKDHAVVMARFANDCIRRMNDLSKLLEVSIGPDTGDLALRVGLHSGPVTAGVLRGEKARFQLFGDTVNTAARMESNGVRNAIHISGETASLLKDADKANWLIPREDSIAVKGKGQMNTFWLEMKTRSGGSTASKSTNNSNSDDIMSRKDKCMTIKAKLGRENGPELAPKLSPKAHRLVKWNCEIILQLLQQVVSRRNEKLRRIKGGLHASEEFTVQSFRSSGQTVIDEFKEIIELPEFDVMVAKNQQDPSLIVLDPMVETQLFDYVSLIASMYRDVPFHNFEHASHVTMSVTKLLSRIIAPDDVVQDELDDVGMSKNLHDHTYGITSDPLTQLAVVFSALIHDVDHTGVSNSQLVKEGAEIAKIYHGKSVAEQNSIDIAWELLMDPAFEELRRTIYGTGEEERRFRQLLVNVVLATDIVDKELKELRNNRWDKAFQGQDSNKPPARLTVDEVNRRATIVLEHIIQASDISHTMQHWHVYRQWNERFFEENMKAFKDGRMENNPADFWYKGEIGFFDFYIIPLAKKLKDCGVFGVSSDEYLNYANQNRSEWERRGEDILAEMVKKYD